MPPDPPATVSITFQSPRLESDQTPSSVHERHLRDVPKSKAERMAEDFAAYQSLPAESTRRKLYRYQDRGNERLVALDFEEVVAVVVEEEGSFA